MARLGARNVFMDVAAIEVGTDFVDQVEKAIAGSDVSLVVIGPNWLRAEDVEGRRRLDDPDDHVRSEVRSALVSANPVVPVLVGETMLPSEDELPDDLAPLVRRQAVELHDDTWPQDVEMLIRRLEGKEVVRPPRRYLPVVIVLIVFGVVGVAVWRGLDDTSTSDDLPPCDTPDGSWTELVILPEATAVEEAESKSMRFTVRRAFAAQGAVWQVLLDIEARNETPDGGNTDGFYFGWSSFNELLVNDVSTGAPVCFSRIAGNSDDVGPREAATAWVGFESTIDPSGAAVALVTQAEEMRIEVTAGS